MPIVTVACPQCRAFLQLDQPVPAGRAIRCARCSATFVPGSHASQEPDPEPPRSQGRPAASARTEGRPKRARRRAAAEAPADPGGEDRAWEALQRQQRKRMMLVSLAVVGGLALIVLGIVLLAALSKSGKGKRGEGPGGPHPPAARPADGGPPGQPPGDRQPGPWRRPPEVEEPSPPLQRPLPPEGPER